MYSVASEHLLNIDFCQNPEGRRGYLAILHAAERAGYETRPGESSSTSSRGREMAIRSGINQPFSLSVDRQGLLFYIRRPALAEAPELQFQARKHFGEAARSEGASANEVRIALNSERDAETLCDWLFPTSGYAERRSA